MKKIEPLRGHNTLFVDHGDETAALTVVDRNGSRRSTVVDRKMLLEALGWGHVDDDACPAEERAAALLQARKHLEKRADSYASMAGDRLRKITELETLLGKRNRQVMALVDLLTKED